MNHKRFIRFKRFPDRHLVFGARELRRAYPQAWDKNIRRREAWFRDDLYALFQGNRYRCLDRETQIFENNETITDIDAAVIDVLRARVAVFQLKWQEPFALNEAERRSRAARLQRDTAKWVGAINGYVRRNGLRGFLGQLGLAPNRDSVPVTVHLFVLSRHHARFSGFDLATENSVVCSWRQLTRARYEIGVVDDPIFSIYERLKSEETRYIDLTFLPTHHEIAGYTFEAEHFIEDADG